MNRPLFGSLVGMLGMMDGGSLGFPVLARDLKEEPLPNIFAVHNKMYKTGTSLCECGKVISRNKDYCRACKEAQ